MDRANPNDNSNILASRPNGRTAPSLVIDRTGSRKDLFSGNTSQENAAVDEVGNGRPGSSDSSAGRRTTSPSTTRIPRPAQQSLSSARKTFTLKDAFKMAMEEEQSDQGSPSPAPRSWRSRVGAGTKTTAISPSQRSAALGNQSKDPRLSTHSLGREDTVSSVDSFESGSLRSDVSGDNNEHGQEQHAKDDSKRFFSRTKLGPKVAEAAKELSRKASNSSLNADSPPRPYREWGTKAKSPSGWLKRLMAPPGNNEPNSPSAPLLESRTPNKSFTWQTDADFTAGDLQISNSPPVKTGSSTGKLDNSEESVIHGQDQSLEIVQPKPGNTRIDDIRQLEKEAALSFPDGPPGSVVEGDDLSSDNPEPDGRFSPNRNGNRTNTKIDEIRAREIESLSKRALATARLDEIRERNAEARSKSTSPDLSRKVSRDLLRGSTPPSDTGPSTNGDALRYDRGERIPDTPVTIFKKSGVDNANVGPLSASGVSRDDSRDLLRRLARAASTSPIPEQQQTLGSGINSIRESLASSAKSSSGDLKKERRLQIKPNVGFAGLHRESSTESSSDKRSSMAMSENDPTERIEREMQLFAPQDNQSERGSIRAPSPESDDNMPDETPRIPKTTFLEQPTPKVTGAFVETPATVKVERLQNTVIPESKETKIDQALADPSVLGRGRETEPLSNRTKQTLSAQEQRAALRSQSLIGGRRARSLPRARSPLVNSARPPTVKDDLLEIQRAHQIEDSTLDNFDELLTAHDTTPPTIEDRSERTRAVKVESSAFDDIVSREKELEAYDRMNKSLKTGLLGIRTAKQGIERLEDKVSNSYVDPKSETGHHHQGYQDSIACPICRAQSSASMVTYLHLPVPRLWQRQPTLRLTFIGFLITLLSVWYAAESATCSLYCKPESCFAGEPCRWSPDDPTWGSAIPVKLDEWLTGGRGRAFADLARPDILDWVADLWDAATGTDFTMVDTSHFTWDQKQQHKRRLMKRGLLKPLVERPEDRAKHSAWKAAAIAKERVYAAREMGFGAEEDESMSRDEKVSRW